jgi:hypothetical protein
MTPKRTSVALQTMQHNGRRPQEASEPVRVCAAGDNLVAPSVPTEVGHTRA